MNSNMRNRPAPGQMPRCWAEEVGNRGKANMKKGEKKKRRKIKEKKENQKSCLCSERKLDFFRLQSAAL